MTPNVNISTANDEVHVSSQSMEENEDNLTAVLYGVDDLRLEQRLIPPIKDDEVLLRTGSVGICGSDIHYFTHGRIGHFVVRKPMVIGHEASGTVIEVGKDVQHLKIGDRVAIEPGYGCRKCAICKMGRYNLCQDMKFCATPPIDGNLTRFFAHAADYCFKLPENVTLDEGALVEPLAVAVHGCNRGNVKVGSKVLILGAGPIGLLTMLTAKAYGASKIVITDIVRKRLEFAKELGVDKTILIESSDTDHFLMNEIINFLGGAPDISFDCSGAEQSVRLAMKVTKPGGTALLIGMSGPEIKLPLTTALIREVDIKGVFRYANCYPTALELIASGKVDVLPLITHHFTIENTLDAFKTAMTPMSNAIKVLIHADATWSPENIVP